MSYSWYKNNRVYAESDDRERTVVFNMTQEYYDDYIGHQTHYEGDLSLRHSEVTSLGKLESVNGVVDLRFAKITSLDNLKSVSEHLFLKGINLDSLGNLEHVGGMILCSTNSHTNDLFENSKFKDKLFVLPVEQYILNAR